MREKKEAHVLSINDKSLSSRTATPAGIETTNYQRVSDATAYSAPRQKV